jgi:transcriptional regulator with XRE-family HTH domain
MRFGAKHEINRKCLDRMKEMGLSFAQLAEKLNREGLNWTASTTYKYVSGRKSPSKAEKKLIAKVLQCLERDIF